jgi:hypothetical protein
MAKSLSRMIERSAPSGRQRLLVSIAVAIGSAALVVVWAWRSHGLGPGGSDFDQIWFAGRALRNGQDPYVVIGPGREFDWYPFFYPLPTALFGIPFSLLPLIWARIVFAGASAGLFAYALTSDGYARLPVLLGMAFLYAIVGVQWSPLLAAALVIPSLGWALPLKPNIGLAIGAVARSRTTIVTAVASGVLLALVSWIVLPTWVQEWRAALAVGAVKFQVPLLTLGGPLLLLSLLRWRRWDAQLLLAYACVPHTPLVYQMLPLALIPATLREAIAFALLSDVAVFAQTWLVPRASDGVGEIAAARVLNFAIFLPCLVMVLRRPNTGSLPLIFERLKSVFVRSQGSSVAGASANVRTEAATRDTAR